MGDDRSLHTDRRRGQTIDRPPNELPVCGCAVPGDADPYLCYCAVEDLMRILRRKYSLAVLNVVRAHGHARFHDMETAIPAASTSTLAETLRALTTVNLLVRDGTGDSVPRSVYRITPSGEKLLQRLRKLLDEVSPDWNRISAAPNG